MRSAFASMPALLQLAATLAVALLFLCHFGADFPCSTDKASHSQDATLALYWMHRTHSTPYRDWFCEPEDGVSETSRQRTFQAVVREGNAVMPLHAIYLWVLGHAVRLYTTATLGTGAAHHTLADFWDPDFFGFLEEEEAPPRAMGDTLFTVRWVSCLFLTPLLFQLSVEVVWPLMVKVAALFAAATGQRRASARAAASQSPSPSPSPSSGEDEDLAETEAHTRTLAIVGFVVTFLAVVLPTMALEMATLHPVCLCTCVLLLCVRLLLADEFTLLSPASYAHECFTNEESEKLFQQGSIFAFPLKKPITVKYLCLAGYFLVAVAMTLRPFFCAVVGLAGWLLTLCYYRVHRRVLVRVKAPDGGADAPEAASDGFVDVGPSYYQDKLYAQACLCYVTTSALAVVLVVCAPFVFQRQSLFDFMHVLAPGYHAERGYYGLSPVGSAGAGLTDAAGKLRRPTEDELYLSVTGAREVAEDCVAEPLALPRHFSCSRPALNIYTISEYFGVPWTPLTVGFASLIATSTADSWKDGSMWMHYVSVTTIVLTNALPALAMLAYRVHRPYMSFDTPKEFVLEYRRQREKFFNYWAARAERLRSRKRYPAPEKPFATDKAAATRTDAEAGKGKHPDDVVKTCISLEEYLLKQLTALLWILLALGITTSLFLVRGGLLLDLASAVLLPAGLLYAMQSMIGCAARLVPEAFAPERNSRRYDHLASLKEEEERQQLAQREHKESIGEEGEEEEAGAGGANAATAAAKGKDGTAAATSHAELPPIPAEHERTRTFTSGGGYSYTTPAYNADGTGWSLSSRWCSPAALGEHTDAAWCLVVITVTVAVCIPAYFLFSPSGTVGSVGDSHQAATEVWQVLFPHGGAVVLAGLLLLFGVELVRCRFYTRMDLLTLSVLFFLQAAGAYALLCGTVLTSAAEAPSGGGEALALWLRSVVQVVTGPPEVFGLLDSLRSGANAAARPPSSFAMWSRLYRCALASLCLLVAGVHASLRLARLMMESEEVRFIDPEKEMDMIYKAAKEADKELQAQRAKEGAPPPPPPPPPPPSTTANHARHKPRRK